MLVRIVLIIIMLILILIGIKDPLLKHNDYVWKIISKDKSTIKKRIKLKGNPMKNGDELLMDL